MRKFGQFLDELHRSLARPMHMHLVFVYIDSSLTILIEFSSKPFIHTLTSEPTSVKGKGKGKEKEKLFIALPNLISTTITRILRTQDHNH